MRPAAHRLDGGFTILEITVVMGLMSIFMVFLIQILFTTTEVFNSGQKSQELTTRALATRRPVEGSLATMVGPTREGKNVTPDARLLVQWEPIGFKEQGVLGVSQVLRATVRIDRERERKLLRESFQDAALDALGEGADEEELEELLSTMVSQAGFKGRGEMLLLTWPEGDPEGAFFDLRRGYFLPGRSKVMTVRQFGEPDFPPKEVPQVTEVIATGLLHLSYRFASQLTRNWTHGPASGGPETAWDSARAGWIPASENESENFSMDLGPGSLTDSRDDVFPRYIEVTLVTGMSAQDLPDSMLTADIGTDDKTIELNNVTRLPDPVHDNYLKIGSEWVQFGSISGRTLYGVRRGLRGTTPRNHDRGTGVRAGKTETIMLRVPHARDSWNG